MHERLHTKQEEMQFLAAEYKEHPDLFAQERFIEDDNCLQEFGIVIPGKETFPVGMLKLWPEDFIVEEVAPDGALSSVGGVPTQLPEGEGDTVYATLVKCGLSTLEVAEDIARSLHLERDRISFAGIKDKDALTAQEISVRGTTREALARLRSPYFVLQNIRAGKGVVEKGRLRGNRFTIVVRTEVPLGEPPQSTAVGRALQQVNEQGFYNFYYLQRFGTPRLRNYEWAYHILRGDYERAVRDILTAPSRRELGYFKELRATVEKHFGDWDAVAQDLAPFPIMLRHERALVEHLLHKPGDYLGALQTIPDQITLWMYALASLFFNKKISEYIARGQEPPAKLPLIMSPDPADWQPYRAMLEKYGIYPLPLKNLRPFPSVVLKKRDAPTKDRARVSKGEIIQEGLLLQFELSKGQYATTFLSHLFNIAAGKVPDHINKARVDSKVMLGEEPLAPTLQHFENVIRPKGENIFEALGERGEI